ncbi:AMP-binding protein [Novosphingobium sp. Chol11]|uniref:AMP-binding protein n=1 Tax=Novosphingobium sp. Chol11 TaxID=1385763 RepID=UPI0025E9B3E1|nr:AMP-binding protein [Novosphingobium sp. Chol11]
MAKALASAELPDRRVCVLRYLLDDWAEARGDHVYAVFEDGTSWTYAELRALVVAKAAGLQKLGVAQGEHVAVWLPNGREALITFFVVNYLGAVFVPFNTAYRGAILEHVLANSDAALLIAHAGLLDRLEGIDRAAIARVIVVGESAEGNIAPHIAYSSVTGEEAELQPLLRPIEPWDNQAIIYTSGTTGPSKGVLASYLHLYTNAGPDSWHFVTGEDRFLVNMPIFHIGGLGLPFVTLARGGSIALMENFSTEGFWPFVRRTGCTAIFLLGVMATFLMKRAPAADDRDHGVRLAFMVPFTAEAGPFQERFGIDVYTIFNMTEISSPIVSGPNPVKPGTCGLPRPGVEVRLVDEHDREVPVGAVGEMMVRTDRPWTMNSGYHKNPEATARAWRNGWFHTGDAFRRDEDGYFYFVDRVKDAIRRRGENISSFEVESQVMMHPAVREAAVIGVPSEYSEDEVMAVIAAVPGAVIDFAELVASLAERLPYFMVPRYIRVLDELPKTPTAKVMKAQLRGAGITADSWDREASGIKLRKEKL